MTYASYMSASLHPPPVCPHQARQPALPGEENKGIYASTSSFYAHVPWELVQGCIYQDRLTDNWALWRLRQINRLIKKL